MGGLPLMAPEIMTLSVTPVNFDTAVANEAQGSTSVPQVPESEPLEDT